MEGNGKSREPHYKTAPLRSVALCAAGYGCCIVPVSSGEHDLKCSMWRPRGTLREQISTFFLGGTPTLKHKEVITSGGDRYRLHTESTGEVHLRLAILTKDFERHGVVS